MPSSSSLFTVRKIGSNHIHFHTGDKQQGALSHPVTPHWSVSMVIEVWWTAAFGVRSEGCSHFSIPQCSLIISSPLTDHLSFSCQHTSSSSSSSSSLLTLRERVATSPDKWRHASLVISWLWLFAAASQLRGFTAVLSSPNLPYQRHHKIYQQQLMPPAFA